MAYKQHNAETVKELSLLIEVIRKLQSEGKILVAVLFGSYAFGNPHKRSDIDLAIYFGEISEAEKIDVIDTILMSVEKDVNILKLNDEDESPFIIQEALKGIHLIEPDKNSLYNAAHRALHETEEIKFRRELAGR